VRVGYVRVSQVPSGQLRPFVSEIRLRRRTPEQSCVCPAAYAPLRRSHTQ